MADDSGGGLTSFLFQGQPPIPVPTGSDTTTNFPLWLQTGIYDVANAAMNLAGQPFTPFPGQQVAAPSTATTQAWQTAQGNVGNYQPALDRASALTNQAATPISASDISNFENPYNQQVVGALQQAANTNLTQNVLPGVQDQFVSAGQSRSPQEMEMTNRALYNEQAALNPAVSQALQTGYQGALNSAQQEKQMEQTAGAQQGQLGALQSQLGSYDVANLSAAGTAQDTLAQSNINTAINNFNQQQQWPYQNLSFVSNMLRGIPTPTTSQTASQTFPSSVGASPFSTALGTAALAGSLGVGAAKGGHIRGGALQGYADGGRFDTPLSDEDEQAFQAWKQNYAPHDSGADYDLRGAFKAGLRPDAKSGHWPDTFKKPNHPTFSDQSTYAKDGSPGHWEGDQFVPPTPYAKGGALGYAAGGEALGRTAGAGAYGTAPLEAAPDWMSALQRNRPGYTEPGEDDRRDEAEVEQIRRALTATQMNRRPSARMARGGALSYRRAA
jgi:hypothetical protein